ncbi:MAG: SsrA-binding protein SmpB [Patescibacteria group bacterium]
MVEKQGGRAVGRASRLIVRHSLFIIDGMAIISVNKRAGFDYEILERFEAGIVLSGQEVKSIKTGHISLAGAFVTLKGSEAWLTNAHVPPYKMAGQILDYDPTQPRKLLLRKEELASLYGKIKQKGLTLVPIRVYTKGNKIKLEFGIGRGKKKYEKRDLIKKREVNKKIREAMKV